MLGWTRAEPVAFCCVGTDVTARGGQHWEEAVEEGTAAPGQGAVLCLVAAGVCWGVGT